MHRNLRKLLEKAEGVSEFIIAVSEFQCFLHFHILILNNTMYLTSTQPEANKDKNPVTPISGQ